MENTVQGFFISCFHLAHHVWFVFSFPIISTRHSCSAGHQEAEISCHRFDTVYLLFVPSQPPTLLFPSPQLFIRVLDFSYLVALALAHTCCLNLFACVSELRSLFPNKLLIAPTPVVLHFILSTTRVILSSAPWWNFGLPVIVGVLPETPEWLSTQQHSMCDLSPRENKGWPSIRKCCSWCSARYLDSFIFHDFLLLQTEAPLSPHGASDSSIDKALSRSNSVIHRLPGSSIIHAQRCWTDWIVTTLVGGSEEGGGTEGGRCRPHSLVATEWRRLWLWAHLWSLTLVSLKPRSLCVSQKWRLETTTAGKIMRVKWHHKLECLRFWKAN